MWGGGGGSGCGGEGVGERVWGSGCGGEGGGGVAVMQRLEPSNHYSSQWGVVAMATPSERGWVGLQLASQCLHTLTLNCPTLEWSSDRSTLQRR